MGGNYDKSFTKLVSKVNRLLIEEYKKGYKNGWEIRDALFLKRKK